MNTKKVKVFYTQLGKSAICKVDNDTYYRSFPEQDIDYLYSIGKPSEVEIESWHDKVAYENYEENRTEWKYVAKPVLKDNCVVLVRSDEKVINVGENGERILQHLKDKQIEINEKSAQIMSAEEFDNLHNKGNRWDIMRDYAAYYHDNMKQKESEHGRDLSKPDFLDEL